MALAQQTQTISLVAGQSRSPGHTCNVTGKQAQIGLTEPGDVYLESSVLSQLETLSVEVTSGIVQVFLPLTMAEAALAVSMHLAANAAAKIFLLARGPARDLQLTVKADEHAHFDLYSLLDDTAARFTYEASVQAGTEATFTGLTRTQSTTATAIEVNVRHLAGNSRTGQKFYSYARDTSQISFTGRITVEPGASGTEAHQLHRGVALSAGARIDAQPFLNIMHDDVRCTHGSTVGFIDEEALAYLMARGLARSVAEQILIHSSERQFFDLVPAGPAREFFGITEEQL